MERILFSITEPEPILLKTISNLFRVFGDGTVQVWNEEHDGFMNVDKNACQEIKIIRYEAFPALFPNPVIGGGKNDIW